MILTDLPHVPVVVYPEFYIDDVLPSLREPDQPDWLCDCPDCTGSLAYVGEWDQPDDIPYDGVPPLQRQPEITVGWLLSTSLCLIAGVVGYGAIGILLLSYL